ncbi:RNA-binding protein 2 [Heracleum sosnowskyi]|uniref:RNA-binding protein 2 n=1 Tax=Heracleum sosnowskyi TaxID=360622 RepID=A0AAD8JHY8_9APIA|nr:RNA-binding protein 2 [Heracleum sosnowskyi]
MDDGYWNRPHQLHPSAGLLKRPRSDFDLSPAGLPLAHDMHNYLAQDDDRLRPYTVKDTESIGSAYDHYLQNGQYSPFTSAEGSIYSKVGLERVAGSGRPAHTLDDHVTVGQPRDILRDLPDVKHPVDAMPRPGHEILPLPRDASSTLYIEGLPANSTRREVAHIFRPFVGYKEVRLVSKQSKHHGRDPLILCFVDFESPACAATAMSAIQGYKIDEHDPDSAYLRLQFSRNPGPRSGGSGRYGR